MQATRCLEQVCSFDVYDRRHENALCPLSFLRKKLDKNEQIKLKKLEKK